MRSFARLFQGVCASFLICAPAVASEDVGEPVPFSTTYDFYIGGLSIAEITLNGAIGALEYSANSTVETRGILEFLVSTRMKASAKGYRHTKGYLAPDVYQTDYTTRSQAREVNISYTGEVADVSIKPAEPVKPYDIRAIDHPGTLDPVTAAVTMMNPRNPEDLCNRSIPVFDGKRRYDIVLLPLSQRPEGKSAPPPSWDAPTIRCFGVYERIAGFEGELQNEQRYFPFDIWFEESADRYHKIVRLAGRTKIGFAIGTLRP
jgi:hypothetical protein